MVKSRVTLADFGTGMLAGLAAEGVRELSVRRLDEALTKAFLWLEAQNLALNFSISLHEIHGDAPEARRAIGGAVSRGLGSFDNDHTLYLAIPIEDAERYFVNLPLTPELWRGAARVTLRHLRGERD